MPTSNSEYQTTGGDLISTVIHIPSIFKVLLLEPGSNTLETAFFIPVLLHTAIPQNDNFITAIPCTSSSRNNKLFILEIKKLRGKLYRERCHECCGCSFDSLISTWCLDAQNFVQASLISTARCHSLCTQKLCTSTMQSERWVRL